MLGSARTARATPLPLDESPCNVVGWMRDLPRRVASRYPLLAFVVVGLAFGAGEAEQVVVTNWFVRCSCAVPGEASGS